MVRDAGLEPANLSVLGPKPSAFANFASRARNKPQAVCCEVFQLRLLKKPVRRILGLRGTDFGPTV